MGFQTPQYTLGKYLEWTTSGKLQLPDFQRGYKWDDERIRSLLATITRGHPLGVVMLLQAGNQNIRFKPKALQGTSVESTVEPTLLLLDGQQRLTSLTQALTGAGIVATMDGRSKFMERRYYINIPVALSGDDRIDEAVLSVPGDGLIKSNFGKDVELDLTDEEKERAAGYFPMRLLLNPIGAAQWLAELPDRNQFTNFLATIIQPAQAYTIPAIELDESTSKGAVATVFEKVNTGGLSLNVFELLTATFAGDKAHFDAYGTDFRLNDDWQETHKRFAMQPALHGVENTDFLQAVTLLTTHKKNAADKSPRPVAISARREDILKLSLTDYLEWVEPLRVGFEWAATFLADHYIFDGRFVPYPKQIVPLAAIRVLLGEDADLHGVRARLAQWYWCGILGELYGGAIETRFARDIEQVPSWAKGVADAALDPLTPRTVQDSGFRESRLLSLRTRNAAAYKGIYALMLAAGSRDWMLDKALDKVQYKSLSVDIHHVFPQAWSEKNLKDDPRTDCIVNKTPLAATTNRSIGGASPAIYLPRIESKAGLDEVQLDALLRTHHIEPALLRAVDFDGFFDARRSAIVGLIEAATGKTVQRDLSEGVPEELPEKFDEAAFIAEPDEMDD